MAFAASHTYYLGNTTESTTAPCVKCENLATSTGTADTTTSQKIAKTTGNYEVEPDNSATTLTGTPSASTPSGYAWETASALGVDIQSGAWTLDLTTTASSATGTATLWATVWSCNTINEGTCTKLFKNWDNNTADNILGTTTATKRTFTTSTIGPFTGIQFLVIEWWVHYTVAGTSNTAKVTETTVDASSDVLTPAFTTNFSPSDSFTVTDSPSRNVILGRSTSDSYVVSDSVAFNKGYARSASDSYVFSDSPTRLATIVRGLSDSFGTTETVARLLVLGRALSDAYTFADSVVRSLILAASPSSSFTTTDSVQANVILSRSTSDTFSFSDSVSASVTKVGGGGSCCTLNNPQGMKIDYVSGGVKSTSSATSITVDSGKSFTVYGLYTVVWSSGITANSYVYDVTPASAGVQILSNVSLSAIGFIQYPSNPNHPYVYFNSSGACSCKGWIPAQWVAAQVYDGNSVNVGWTFSYSTQILSETGPTGHHEWDLAAP